MTLFATGSGVAELQDWYLYPGTLRRGKEETLGRDQHEGRLEAHLCVRRLMSAIGTKRTYRVALHMSAFGGKADIAAVPIVP